MTGDRVELFAERAWLGPDAGVVSGVVIEVEDGSITAVRTGEQRARLGSDAVRLPGDVCLPGFVNTHSHAFHRALRGESSVRSGDFWTWRDLMYSVAERLDPSSYEELATLVYAEMLLAGYTTVGEFHYLHHQAGGVAYTNANAMGAALVAAASGAGIRMTLLDACYLQAGAGGEPLTGVQMRFGDASGEKWSERVRGLADAVGAHDGLRLGVAIHSVRAVPKVSIASVVALAHDQGWPLHVHLSEQRRENEQCLAATGLTPSDLLHTCGALGPATTAVHATHLTVGDIGRLGLARCGICACPTTERDLGDGVGPFSDLADAGCVLSVGSDSHAVIDPFEETRAVELNERLSSERRGLWRVAALLSAGSAGGARSLGWPDGGIAPGSPADLVTVRLDSVRLAGRSIEGELDAAASEALLSRVVFGGSPADIDAVVVGGKVVVSDGQHARFGPPAAIARRLGRAVTRALGGGS